MSIETVLLTQLTLAAAKFLFKRYLGEQGQIVGPHGEVLHDGGLLGEAGDVVVDVLADLAKDRIKDAIDRMEAVGDIRRYALKVVRQIQSRLDQEAKDNPLIDSQGIAEQLTLTLQADLSTGLLLKHDLEPRKLVEAYVSLRPLPQGVLNIDSDLAYERMLDHAVQCLVGVASQLPDFQPQAMVESLRRLRQLDDNVEQVLQQLARVTQEVQRLAEAGDPQRFEIEYRQAVAANLCQRRHRLAVRRFDRRTIRLSRTDKRRELRQTFISGPASLAENLPLVRVGLNRLLGVLVLEPLGRRAAFYPLTRNPCNIL